MATFDVGDLVPVTWSVEVDEVPTNGTVTLTVTAPDGTSSTPSVSNPEVGSYTATVPAAQAGMYLLRWVSVGGAVPADEITFDVRRVGSNVIRTSDVRARLNKTLTVDDVEIQEMIDAALAEYEEWVGPLPGTRTETLSGGQASLILRAPNATAVTALTYTDGTVVDVDDLSLDTATGILHWGYNTAGWFTAGTRNVTVTYTVGGIPANHRETIIADVAGYFAATQRGSQSRRFPGEGYAEPFDNPTGPVVLFPRIRDLAPPSVA
jgi:hypothetical protein